ncbi:MAG: hypothetical protein ABI855_04825 [Bacteroidota bacterium]
MKRIIAALHFLLQVCMLKTENWKKKTTEYKNIFYKFNVHCDDNIHRMIRSLAVFLVLIFAQPVVNAQEKSQSKKVSQRKQTRIMMKGQITQLKDGALLVRLQTKENSIIALSQIGKYDLSDKIKNRQLNYNKEIISAFKNNFTFCPVYFFFSSYSDSILSGHVKGIIFLNDSLLPDTGIKMKSGKFLTAEFGIIEQDTTKYFSNYYFCEGENGLETKSLYYGGPDLRFGVLKIMSDQLVQLKEPFPYYVRTFNSLPVKRKLSKAVLRMNKKLLSYYEKNKGK